MLPPVQISKMPALNLAAPSGANLTPDEMQMLRELRAEVQDFQSMLAGVRAGQTTTKAYAAYINQTREDVTGLMKQIPTTGDALRHLHNVWEQICASPLLNDPTAELPAQEQLHQINTLDDACQKIIFQVGVLTIPARVNDWLASARPGYSLPFHAVFMDEVPNRDDRDKILNFLAWSPNVIQNGLVDAANGVIYRYSQNPRTRVGTIVLFIAAVIAIILALIVLPFLHNVSADWPLQSKDTVPLLVGWAAVLGGILIHVAVDFNKRTQVVGGAPPTIVIGDLPLYINAKIGMLLFKLLLSLVAVLGMALGAGMAQVTPINSFLLGYSLDSIVGLFGASIEQRASAQVGVLKQQLGVTDARG